MFEGTIVVYVNDTHSTRLQACLDKVIVVSKVILVQRGVNIPVDKVLPTHWKSKDVEPLGDEVLHLIKSIPIRGRWAVTVASQRTLR